MQLTRKPKLKSRHVNPNTNSISLYSAKIEGHLNKGQQVRFFESNENDRYKIVPRARADKKVVVLIIACLVDGGNTSVTSGCSRAVGRR